LFRLRLKPATLGRMWASRGSPAGSGESSHSTSSFNAVFLETP